MTLRELTEYLPDLLGDDLLAADCARGDVTAEIKPASVVAVCAKLRDDARTQFTTLIDLCGVDYSTFGTDADHAQQAQPPTPAPRFAVVYHLLSVRHNLRLRLRARLDEESLAIDSVTGVWPAADWYEREAFDLFGIVFNGHPDLRRLLTDYGFIGHPFRKDFPLSGEVEMRYDEQAGRVIYEPVTIEPRTLVPRTLNVTKPE